MTEYESITNFFDGETIVSSLQNYNFIDSNIITQFFNNCYNCDSLINDDPILYTEIYNQMSLYANHILLPQLDNNNLCTVFYSHATKDHTILLINNKTLEMITKLELGMYRPSDKIPFLAVLSSGNCLLKMNMTIILQGYNNTIALKSNSNGVIAEYIVGDIYYDVIGISPNYMVYKLVEMIENQYVTDIKLEKATKANATYRQLHRKFV